MVVPVVVHIETVPPFQFAIQFAIIIRKSLVSISIFHDVLKPRVKHYRYWKATRHLSFRNII